MERNRSVIVFVQNLLCTQRSLGQWWSFRKCSMPKNQTTVFNSPPLLSLSTHSCCQSFHISLSTFNFITLFSLLLAHQGVGVELCWRVGSRAPSGPPNFENFLNIYIIIWCFQNLVYKNKSWPPQIFELVQWCF